MTIENQFFYTDYELELIKSTFADNEPLLKLMRKVFVPRYLDTAADIGGLKDDVNMFPEFDVTKYPSIEQAQISFQARMLMLNHTENSLLRLKVLAGEKKETVEQTKARLVKDSSK